MEPSAYTCREREREEGKDQQGHSTSSNGEMLVADAKAGDASKLLTVFRNRLKTYLFSRSFPS